MSCVSWCDYDGELPDKVDPDSRLVSWEVTLGTFSDWFRDQALGILEYQTPVIPTQLYVAAHSTASDPTAAGTELSGDNYFRTPITFERVSDIQVRNAAPATTQLATGDWENILSFSLWDDPTGGNFYAFGNLVQPLAITAGRGIQFPAQNVTVGIGAATGATGQLSNWFINEILKVFLLQTPVVPTQLQIGAHSTVSTAETAGEELSGSNYSRTDLTLSTANDRLRWNASRVESAVASVNWTDILSYSVNDASGNYYGFDNLNAAQSIASGEAIIWSAKNIRVGLGGITFNETTGTAIGLSFDPQTPLGKPRYTPEPPVESMDPAARAYYRRELERISDLWPKDYGRRIAALEALVPYATGVWPIVDGGFVSFIGEGGVVSEPVLAVFDSAVGTDELFLSDTGVANLTSQGTDALYDGIQYLVANPNGVVAWYAGASIRWTDDRFSTINTFTPSSPGFDATDGALSICWDTNEDRWVIAGAHDQDTTTSGGNRGALIIEASEKFTTSSVLYENYNTGGGAGTAPSPTNGAATDGNGRFLFFSTGGSGADPYIWRTNDNFFTVTSNSFTTKLDNPTTFNGAFYLNNYWFLVDGRDGRLIRQNTQGDILGVASWAQVTGGSDTFADGYEIVSNGSVLLWYWTTGSNIGRMMRSTDNGANWSFVASPQSGNSDWPYVTTAPLGWIEDYGFLFGARTEVWTSPDGSSGSWTQTAVSGMTNGQTLIAFEAPTD